MLRLAVAGLLSSSLVACSTSSEGPPRATEACDAPEPARCGLGEGLDAKANTVLVCDDAAAGAAWDVGLVCPNGGSCQDDDARGAVLCIDEDRVETPYAEQSGPCDVADAQACSFDLDFILVCEGGSWSIATNCSTDVARCTLVDQGSDPACDAAGGCLLCV